MNVLALAALAWVLASKGMLWEGAAAAWVLAVLLDAALAGFLIYQLTK